MRTSITSRFVFSRAHVVTVSAYLGSRSAGLCACLPAASASVRLPELAQAAAEAPRTSANGQVGLRYAGQIATIEVDDTTLRVYDQREYLIKAVPHTSRKELTRHKAYGHSTNRKTS